MGFCNVVTPYPLDIDYPSIHEMSQELKKWILSGRLSRWSGLYLPGKYWRMVMWRHWQGDRGGRGKSGRYSDASALSRRSPATAWSTLTAERHPTGRNKSCAWSVKASPSHLQITSTCVTITGTRIWKCGSNKTVNRTIDVVDICIFHLYSLWLKKY